MKSQLLHGCRTKIKFRTITLEHCKHNALGRDAMHRVSTYQKPQLHGGKKRIKYRICMATKTHQKPQLHHGKNVSKPQLHDGKNVLKKPAIV